MRALRWVTTVALLGMSVVAVGATPGVSSVAVKKSTACSLLTSEQVSTIVGAPVGAPTPSKSGGVSVCDYDIGDGLLSPGGGLVVTQLYRGVLGANIFSAAKNTDEKVGAVYWNAESGIATARRKGATIAGSISVAGTRSGDHRDDSVALVTEAMKKV